MSGALLTAVVSNPLTGKPSACMASIFGPPMLLRSARIEAHALFILGAIETKTDITLVELQALLAGRGTPVGIGTLWRFFDRHRITRKKRLRTPPSKTVPTF